MTGLAALRKRAAMRVAVAIRALPERDAGVARLLVRTGRVALLARNLDVQPGQRKSRLGVIELRGTDGLPVGRVVALSAIVAKPSLVSVLMATYA